MNKFIITIILLLNAYSFELIAQDIENDSLANYHFKKGMVFKAKRKRDSSSYYLQLAKDSYKAHENWEGYFESWAEIAQFLTLQGKFEQAEEENNTILEALELQLGSDNIYEGMVLKNLGELYLYQSKITDAIDFLEKSLSLFDKYSEDKHAVNRAAIQHNLAGAYFQTGYVDLAVDMLENALELYTSGKIEGQRGLSSVYNNLGNLYYFIGHLDKAVIMFNASISVLQRSYKNKNHPRLIPPYANLANLLRETGRLEKAREYLEQNISIFNNNPNVSGVNVGPTYGIMAQLCFLEKKYDEAKKYLDLSYDFTLENYGAESIEMSDVHAVIGDYYMNSNQFDKGIESFERSRAILKDKQLKNEAFAMSYYWVGLMELMQGEMKKGLRKVEQGIELLKEIGPSNSVTLIGVYDRVGEELRRAKAYELSKQYLENSISLNMHDGWDFNKREDFALGDYLSGEPLLNSLLNYSKLIIEKSDQDINSMTKALSYLDLSDTLVSQLQEQRTNYEDKLAFRETVDDLYKSAINICYQLYKKTDATNYVERAHYFFERNRNTLSLMDLNNAQAKVAMAIPDSIQNLENEINAQINYHKGSIYEMSQAKHGYDTSLLIHHQEKLFETNRRREELLAQIEDQFPSYAGLKFQINYPGLAKIQESIDEGTDLLEYSIREGDGYLIRINRNKVDFIPLSIDAKFTQLLADYRVLLTDATGGNIEGFVNTSHKIYEILIGPLNKGLNRKLIIIPDGNTSLIPFETLVINDQNGDSYGSLDYLIKDFEISYLNTTSGFGQQNEKENDVSGMIAFSPAFEENELISYNDSTRSDLSPLTWTETEVDNISKYFNSEVYKNENASESNFKKHANNKAIIHIASHGIVDYENPYFSRLVLATGQDDTNNDGILYLHELYNMHLNTELAILSACNTGYGRVIEGEGVINLGNGFLGAGVKSVVNSLWLVNDKSTAELMQLFYKNLDKGDVKDQALRKAKLTYIENADALHQHPYFWAPFVINGEMRPLKTGTSWIPILVAILTVIIAFTAFYRLRKSRNT